MPRPLLLALAALAALLSCSTAPKPRTEVNERKNRAAEFTRSGNERFAQGDYRQALSFFTLALNENVAVDNLEGICSSYNSIGMALLAQGEKERAEASFTEALRLAGKLADPRLAAQSASNLGELALARGQPQKALEYLQFAESQIAGQAGAGPAIVFHNLGAACKQLDRPAEAMAYFQKALAINLDLKRFEEAASNYYMIASLCSGQEDYPGAFKALNEALRYDRLMERSRGIAQDLHALGALYEKTGDDENALEHYHRSYLVYRSLSMNGEAARLLPLLLALAERTGRTAEAESYRRLQAEPGGK
jgi:tetratricopeptide (TPR) repeat protein